MVLGLAGCGSSNNNSSSTSGYTYSNGVCYNSSGTVVSTSYCTSSYNSTYFSWNGTTCTNLQTGASVNTAYCTSNPFTYNSNGCYDSISGTYVASQYCTSTSSTTGYSYVNGVCVNTSTGYQVATSYCSSTTTTTSGYTTQTCNGMYYYSTSYGTQLVQCYSQYGNCRGYILYSVSTKQPVYCQ